MKQQKDAKSYLKLLYARILIPAEEGGFSAEILEFPGCYADGETPNEAFENLESVAESWIEATLEQGQEIPPPLRSNQRRRSEQTMNRIEESGVRHDVFIGSAQVLVRLDQPDIITLETDLPDAFDGPHRLRLIAYAPPGDGADYVRRVLNIEPEVDKEE